MRLKFSKLAAMIPTVLLAGGLLGVQSAGPAPGPSAGLAASPLWGFNYDFSGNPRVVVGNGGVVAADTAICSQVGLGVLQSGGNAVDAGVATVLCQGLVNPESSGVGGGGFILIRTAGGSQYEVVDSREEAPSLANETLYANNPNGSLIGGLAIAVPLELKGLYLAHERHGTLPWSSLVQPAIALAENGFPTGSYLAQAIQGMLSAIQMNPLLAEAVLIKESNGSYRAPLAGETCCKRPTFAKFLQAVAANGSDALYNPTTAATIADEIGAAGGIITAQDLLNIEPKVKAASSGSAFGAQIYTAPPPSSGALAIAGLRILDALNAEREPLAGAGALESHWLVETFKQIYALRLDLGDPDYANITSLLEDILSPSFAMQLASIIQDNTTLPLADYGGPYGVNGSVPTDSGTSHISIVGPERDAFAMTTTVNSYFGSQVVSASTGIIFNDQMDDFSQPGKSNQFGFAPSPSNYIRPGAKPLSTMSPTILEVGGQIRMVVGASGGSRILTVILQSIERILAKGLAPFDAVSQPRIHHQLLPDVVDAENYKPPFSSDNVAIVTNPVIVQGLLARGHNVTFSSDAAICQAVIGDPDTGYFTGVSDPRKDGAPSGYNSTAPAPSLQVGPAQLGSD